MLPSSCCSVGTCNVGGPRVLPGGGAGGEEQGVQVAGSEYFGPEASEPGFQARGLFSNLKILQVSLF